MRTQGIAYRVSIYVNEEMRYHGQALYMAVFDLLRKEGASGATVMRGLAGYGVHSHSHSASTADLATILPIIVEWIDSPQAVDRLLPEIRRIVNDALITLEEIRIIQ